jgi:hypothetical protein
MEIQDHGRLSFFNAHLSLSMVCLVRITANKSLRYTGLDVAELTDKVRSKTGATYQQSMQAVLMVFEFLEKNLPLTLKDRIHLKLEV